MLGCGTFAVDMDEHAMSSSNPTGSGTRPMTDGGVDNVGAAEAFSTRKNALGEPVSGPAPKERMRDKAEDAESAEHDDSVPLNLHGDQHGEPNTEPQGPASGR